MGRMTVIMGRMTAVIIWVIIPIIVVIVPIIRVIARIVAGRIVINRCSVSADYINYYLVARLTGQNER
jgi:hypothetical protein